MILNKIFLFCCLCTLINCDFSQRKGVQIRIDNISDENILNTKEINLLFSRELNQIKSNFQITITDNQGNQLNSSQEWASNQELSLEIIAELTRSQLYQLEVNGLAYDLEMRDYRLQKTFYFYWESDRYEERATISALPQELFAASVDQVIQLNFSKSIDKEAVEQEIIISPRAKLMFDWESDHTVRIAPQQRWENHLFYTITIPEAVVDSQGLRISEKFEYSFYTDQDFPEFKLISTSILVDYQSDTRIPYQNQELSSGDILLFEFSNFLTEDNLQRAVELMPRSNFDISTEENLLFFKLSDGSPIKNYQLNINSQLKDIFGQLLDKEYRIEFCNGEEFLRINRINLHDIFANRDFIFEEIDESTIYEVEILQDLEDIAEVDLQIDFSQPFFFPENNLATQRISFLKIFPHYLGLRADLLYFNWNQSANILNLRYQIKDAIVDQEYFFQIVINEKIESSAKQTLAKGCELNLKIKFTRS
ncbi:MAG: Ig-like domain-containing protein [Spirochaetales bacterium]|nr:Ig-like domain-containing protein [Spirochaetales bacterium]